MFVEVHDLHIWSLSVGKPMLTAHLWVEGGHHPVDQKSPRKSESGESHNAEDEKRVLQRVSEMLAKRFAIHHTTIQVEAADDLAFCDPSALDGHAHGSAYKH